MDKFETFYQSLTKNEFQIVSKLKEIVSIFPSLKEKISYSVPYYFKNSRICFIWPASIKPGPKAGVQFGFCNGYLINDKHNILEKENRKQVYCITYHHPNQINKSLLIEYLENAIAIDESLFSKNK
ncbi:DUF1801 domain-containing protein [Leptospira bourretii]|uniref:DUF1801 domain-containing protein n=1 Tax=Leptospira bourretii TaxID=2484962 RepID=A0A4R9IPL0_9LEPT|nr:DUF1801 domain-containing protein [Leptospira bourretii]TGK90157.1 DUF1801 domain-containing protein [Leptospira bourretii]TGK93819.1 DUF1801 domain-containing protein [Leptospira bourretii]TGL22825.1 DUF1801 domain-containing protein [Leptospira bourretii]TGL26501.1 DUF1801 domain-containing protein [Leptospira bourretii]